MRLPVWVLCLLLASSRGTFITIGDENFCDEDARLVAELKRRINHDRLIKTFRPRKIPKSMYPNVRTLPTKNNGPSKIKSNNKETYKGANLPDFRRKENFNGDSVTKKPMSRLSPTKFRKNYKNRGSVEKKLESKSAPTDFERRDVNTTHMWRISTDFRRNYDIDIVYNKAKTTSIPLSTNFRRRIEGTHKDDNMKAWFARIPVERVMRHKIIDLTEQAIYTAQYRIKDLEPISKLYHDTLEFRIHYIFKRLEMIEYELEVIYSYLILDAGWSHSGFMRVFQFMIYYEYVLARHVDVTYMCERLAYLHGTNEGKRMKDQAANKQEYRPILPSNMTTDSSFGPMEIDDVVKSALERERQNKLKLEEIQNRPQITLPRPNRMDQETTQGSVYKNPRRDPPKY